MNSTPLGISLLFLVTVPAAFFALRRAARNSLAVTTLAAVWIALQSAISLSGVYRVTNTLPPRLFLGAIFPPLLTILLLCVTPAGRAFLRSLDLKWCVLIHTVRILVELTLFALFRAGEVPRLLTFEGGNLDILIGLSAPVIWWAFTRGKLGRRGLLLWNTVALLSVANAVVRALLSAPFRFQRFAFDQPTVAILHFPFVLLPAFVVPAVLLCHAAVFSQAASLALPGVSPTREPRRR